MHIQAYSKPISVNFLSNHNPKNPFQVQIHKCNQNPLLIKSPNVFSIQKLLQHRHQIPALLPILLQKPSSRVKAKTQLNNPAIKPPSVNLDPFNPPKPSQNHPSDQTSSNQSKKSPDPRPASRQTTKATQAHHSNPNKQSFVLAASEQIKGLKGLK